MNRKKITSTDVAKRAGVSQSAVSMILNKKYNVSFSRETIQKVEQAASELGYSIEKKNKIQRTKMRGTIFVVCPNFTNPYYFSLLEGIEKTAQKNRYDVFVCNTRRDYQTEEKYLKKIEKLNPSGMIYTCSPTFPELVKKIGEKIPVVLIGEKDTEQDLDTIELNSEKIGRMIGEYLLSLGHRKAAFLSTPLTKRQSARRARIKGFFQAFEKAGYKDQVQIRSLPEEIDVIFQDVDMEYRTGYELALQILKEEPDITAMVGTNDMVALGIRDALLSQHYKIPDDMSIIGCDNSLISSVSGIDLTTVEHYSPKKGEDACKILMEKINHFRTGKEERKSMIHHLEYEPRLVIRGTTGYPRNL